MRQERLRKSDHLNPLQRHPGARAGRRTAGFRIARIRYYTPIVGGFVENIVMRIAERAMARRAAQAASAPPCPAEAAEREAIREARTAAKRHIANSPATYAALRGLSAPMELDLLALRAHPFGPVLRPAGEGVSAAPRMRILYCALDQTVPGTVGGSVHVRRSPRDWPGSAIEVQVLVSQGRRRFPRRRRVDTRMRPPLGRQASCAGPARAR